MDTENETVIKILNYKREIFILEIKQSSEWD